MKESIRQHALDLGFDDCRITTADPPASAAHFERWLAAGCHGSMGYLQRNALKRADPAKVLPGIRSIITLAVSYTMAADLRADQGIRFPGSESSRSASTPQAGMGFTAARGGGVSRRTSSFGHLSSPFIARYARFIDYHDILSSRLKALSEFVTELGGTDHRSIWYVDTGPVLERDLAQRSGLGFIGKHTNLISRKLGNWIFLSEILTTVMLEPDAPERNFCGSCTRCLGACPTRAITAPFELDARRCLSYLTIEHKGPIPEDLRPAIGNRIYGCDDCLAVCPWNRFAREGRLMIRHARADLAVPSLVELLSLDNRAFNVRFAGTPVLRAKRRGFLRNVSVALGNVGDFTAIPALERASCDPEPLIAEHARWATARIEQRANRGTVSS